MPQRYKIFEYSEIKNKILLSVGFQRVVDLS